MKNLLIFALLLLTSCASLDTYNARAWKPNKTGDSVIFENDKGVAVLEQSGVLTPYTYKGIDPNDWYWYNFKTQGVDEREAKSLKIAAVGYALDPITSAYKLSHGCVEANSLAKNLSPAQMLLFKGGAFGLLYLANYQSTIYQSTLKHDTRKNAVFSLFNFGLSAKNLAVKC